MPSDDMISTNFDIKKLIKKVMVYKKLIEVGIPLEIINKAAYEENRKLSNPKKFTFTSQEENIQLQEQLYFHK